jgi:hypothetical protein
LARREIAERVIDILEIRNIVDNKKSSKQGFGDIISVYGNPNSNVDEQEIKKLFDDLWNTAFIGPEDLFIVSPRLGASLYFAKFLQENNCDYILFSGSSVETGDYILPPMQKNIYDNLNPIKKHVMFANYFPGIKAIECSFLSDIADKIVLFWMGSPKNTFFPAVNEAMNSKVPLIVYKS